MAGGGERRGRYHLGTETMYNTAMSSDPSHSSSLNFRVQASPLTDPGIQALGYHLLQLPLDQSIAIHHINAQPLRLGSTSHCDDRLGHKLSTAGLAQSISDVESSWQGPLMPLRLIAHTRPSPIHSVTYLVLAMGVRPMVAPPAGSVVRPPGRMTVKAIDLRR